MTKHQRRIMLQGGYMFEVQHQHAEHLDVLEHRANAYPKLVAELAWAVRELGALANQGRASHSSMARGDKLLRELGESA